MDLTFDFLYERGFIPTTVMGITFVYKKWGLSLYVHGDFISCWANISINDKPEQKYIFSISQLIELEKLMKIDQTPIITQLSVDELKALIPQGYTYILNKRKKKIPSTGGRSFETKKGRYRILKGDEIISEGYNDEDEDYFLSRSLLYILESENLLPKNSEA